MRTEVRKAGTVPDSRAAAAEYDLKGRTLVGHASVLDYEYPISGERAKTFTEVVRKGAFRSVASNPPIVQAHHGRDSAIGSTPIAELLEAREDSVGLYFRARLFDAPQLDLLREALASGQMSGASFRFQVLPGGERWSKNDTYRELTNLSVLELGPVLWAASGAASVKLRAPGEEPVMRPWDWERMMSIFKLKGDPSTFIRQMKQRGLSERHALVLETAFKFDAPDLLFRIYRMNK